MALGDRVRAAGQGIFAYFARHPTAANLLMLLMVVAGLAAGTQIRSQFFPDVVINEVRVFVDWDGAGAEDVDTGIVAVLEPALLAVEGVESAEARALPGRARIDLEFEPGWDMGRAGADVEAAVAGVTGLPEAAETPRVTRREWRDRVTDAVIWGPVTPEQLARYADEFTARLWQAGITRTTVRGVANPVIRVAVPEAQLIRHGLTLREVADAVAAGSRGTPAGEVSGDGTRLRAGDGRRGVEAIGALVVRSDPGGDLQVRDVANLSEDGADAGAAYFRDGYPAVTIRVDRGAQGDAIGMQAAVAEIAAELAPTLPEGVGIELVRTRAEGITDRLDLLLRNGLAGLALVVGLLFLFLSARTALWVAAGIPVAMAAAVALMLAGGLTLNMISLFGLILCLGLVVDDAIVVAEHADWRRRRLGEPPAVAAEQAARRMALPVFSAMVTTVLAFFALLSIGGRYGALIADIPFTVIAVLCASLMECFLILPHHMAGALAAQARGGRDWIDAPSRAFNRGLDIFRQRAFLPLVALVVRLRYPAIAAAILLLAQATAMFVRGDVSWRFFAPPERGSITANVAMLPGATRDDTQAMVTELQRAAAAVDAGYATTYGRAPSTSAVALVGGTAGRGIDGEEAKDPDQLGGIDIEIVSPDVRPYSSDEFLRTFDAEVVRHPLLETLSFRTWRSGPDGALEIDLLGSDARVLKAAAEAVRDELAPFPVVSGLSDSLAYDKTELVLDLTPLGARLGFTIAAVGAELSARLTGIEATDFPVDGRTATVRVGLPEDEITADFLDRTRLMTDAGAQVPLHEIVSVTSRPGFSTIEREDGRRVVTVVGEVAEDDPDAAAGLTRLLEREILPGIAERYGIETRFGGLAADERDFLGDALTGFLLCLAGIYLTLAWVFESWLRPIVVLAIIPLGLIGTIWGHWQWGLPLSMFSVVGLIGMTGIIVNNAIVLIATIDGHLTRRATIPAVIAAAGDRLRPILLTSLTTVLGLTPMLFERSSQALFLKPTVVTLVYGLGVGSLLVLVLVPALVVVQRDVGLALRAWRRGLGGHGARGTPRALRAASIAAGLWMAFVLGPWVLGGAPSAPAAWISATAGTGPATATAVALILGLAAVALGTLAAAGLTLPRSPGYPRRARRPAP